MIDAVEAMGEGGREGFWMSDEEIWGSEGEDEDREDVRRAMSVFGYRVDGREINADDNEDEIEKETGEVEECEKEGGAKVEVVSVASGEEAPVPKKTVEDAAVKSEAAADNGAPVIESSSSHSLCSSSSGTVHSAASSPAASQGTCVGSVSADDDIGKGAEKEREDKLADVDVVEVKAEDVEVKAEDVEDALPALVEAAMQAVAVAQVAPDDVLEPNPLNVDVTDNAVPIPVPIPCPS